MEHKLFSQTDDVDMNCILDIVLDDIDNMMLAHIPPIANTSYPYTYLPPYNGSTNNASTLWSATNSAISPINSTDSCTNTSGNMNNMNNMNNINISIFSGGRNGLKPELKDHIFISKDITYRLSQYIIAENWGKDGVLLYKYLDYIFRCQLFDKQVIKVVNNKSKTPCLIFHTGLQRRYDNEYLYVLLFPNYISVTHKNKQKWRVQFGNISDSFLSKSELLIKLKEEQYIMHYLPQKTIFYQSRSDCVYNPIYSIQVSWEERLITNKDRIYKVIGNDAFFDIKRKHLKLTQLINAFDNALNKTKEMLLINSSLVVQQGFVDTKKQKYRMELLIPLAISFNHKIYTFALAIALTKNNKKNNSYYYYAVKSVLTLKMAYANSRLIGSVDSNWLKN